VFSPRSPGLGGLRMADVSLSSTMLLMNGVDVVVANFVGRYLI